MDPKLFATVFATIFIAELGDKTQLATLLYASDAAHPKLTVFAASASALVLAAGLGVLAGAWISDWLDPRLVRWAAGLGFVAVGLWVLFAPEGAAA
jgi:putative Ca2+/H+ antiporter (TMEM165/GDT1 family)